MCQRDVPTPGGEPRVQEHHPSQEVPLKSLEFPVRNSNPGCDAGPTPNRPKLAADYPPAGASCRRLGLQPQAPPA
eukprot:7748881-Pyramimonas_sp.AAC.1